MKSCATHLTTMRVRSHKASSHAGLLLTQDPGPRSLQVQRQQLAPAVGRCPIEYSERVSYAYMFSSTHQQNLTRIWRCVAMLLGLPFLRRSISIVLLAISIISPALNLDKDELSRLSKADSCSLSVLNCRRVSTDPMEWMKS